MAQPWWRIANVANCNKNYNKKRQNCNCVCNTKKDWKHAQALAYAHTLVQVKTPFSAYIEKNMRKSEKGIRGTDTRRFASVVGIADSPVYFVATFLRLRLRKALTSVATQPRPQTVFWQFFGCPNISIADTKIVKIILQKSRYISFALWLFQYNKIIFMI